MSNEQTPNLNTLPGASSLGRGYNVVTASSPEHYTQRVISLDGGEPSTVEESGAEYLLPANVELISGKSHELNFESFASRAEYAQYQAAQVAASASAWGFSGRFNASYSSLTQDEEAAIYGFMEANTTLWQVILKGQQGLSLDPTFQRELADLPTTFDHGNAAEFYSFFDKYGTHVVTSALVGGSLRYMIAVSTASHFSKQDAKAKIELEYKCLFAKASASASAEWSSTGKSWLSSRKARLKVEGGLPNILSKFVPPDDPDSSINFSGQVEEWGNSVVKDPKVIALHLQPLPNVAPANQFAALNKALDAYLNDGIVVSSRAILRNRQIEEAACSVTIDGCAVKPKSSKSDAGGWPYYWLVLATEAGKVVFNEAAFDNDPDAFDRLIANAVSTSKNETLSVVAIQCGVARPPSASALVWLSSCGVPDPEPGGWAFYPHWPIQMVAIGKTGSPAFRGRIATVRGPSAGGPSKEDRRISVGLPSHVKVIV